MSIRLFADTATPHHEEILAGVPAGTADRLAAFEAQRTAGTLLFSWQALAATQEFQMGEAPDFESLACAQLELDAHLSRLSTFRHCGFGRTTSLVRACLEQLGLDPAEGRTADPATIARLLACQGVQLSADQKALVTAVFWG